MSLVSLVGDVEYLLSRGTLIIVPLSLIQQWCSEIKRFCPELHKNMLLFYGRTIHLTDVTT